MTRAQMAARLQRRLQDTTDEQWDAAARNELLNDGLREIQKRVILIDPYFLIYVDRADVVNGEARIKKPVGFLYEFKLERKTSATGDYSKMTRLDDVDASVRASNSTANIYSHDGQYFKLSPTPSASVASGLQLTWMPTLAMAADTDVPDLHIALHFAVVLAAQVIALGDTGVARESVAAELESQAGPEVISRYYHRTAADPDYIQIDSGRAPY